MVTLDKYAQKRDLSKTPEPEGGDPTVGLPRFVVQLHRATRLHYDFRLENQGVLKSWAVPKGPSMNPSDKRLAVMVEDHPLDYRLFEGIIPKGNYGAGTVMVWDEGTFVAPDCHSREDIEHALKLGLHKGHVAVFLNGEKLRGLFDLIKLKGQEDNAWLLMKRPDEFATSEQLELEPHSALSSRTLEEIRTGAPESGKVWYSDANPEPIDLADAPESPMPRGVKPMLAVETEHPFDRAGWIFEIKWDGFRAIAEVELERDIQLYSRNGLSFNDRFPLIVDELRSIGHAAVLDGEIVVVDDEGISQFQWLQDYGKANRGTLLYYVFDLLYLDGHDLRGLPLSRRKQLLRLLVSGDGRIRFSDHVETEGCAFYEAARARGLEGIMAKRVDRPYQAGRRSRDWQKIKCLRDQLAVVGGFTQPRHSRKHFGALVLGVYDDGLLNYIGHTGGGFDEATLARLSKILDPITTEQCPFVETPKTNMPVRWVRPDIVCSITFRGWTEAGLLRQPVFKEVVENEDPQTVHRGHADLTDEEKRDPRSYVSEPNGKSALTVAARPKSQRFAMQPPEESLKIDGHQLKLTNLDKVLWPDDGYTKGDLIAYYRGVNEYILPYLRDRPESLNRHPNGIDSQSFFQKDMPQSIPGWLKTVDLESGSEGKRIRYLLCQDEATLVFMANLACIEINPWNSSVGNLDHPDYAVIDLDPHEVDFEAVIESALAVRAVLDQLGVIGYPKTSGATGIHIFIPLGAQYESAHARQFAEVVARMVIGRLPNLTSVERMPARRVGRVYVDFLQNRDGQTLASAYSVRPRPGAPVSTPLRWDEVKPGLDPAAFTIHTMHDRLADVGDLWAPVISDGIDMAATLAGIG